MGRMPLRVVFAPEGRCVCLDEVVPASHSDKLYKKAGTPKLLWTLQGAGHTEAMGRFRASTAPRLLRFLEYALSGERVLTPTIRASAGP